MNVCAAVTFRQFIANLLFNLQRMPTLNNLYDQLSTVISEYDDCVLTCSIPFARRRRRPPTTADSAASDLFNFNDDYGFNFIPRVSRRSDGRRRQQKIAAASDSPGDLIPSARQSREGAMTARRKPVESQVSTPNGALSVLALTLFGSKHLRCIADERGCDVSEELK